MKIFNNIADIFKEYTEVEDALHLKFNSQYSEHKEDNCILYSDYLDNYTDKECTTEQIIEEWMKNLEVFKRMNSSYRPIKWFNYTTEGVVDFKQNLVSNAFRNTASANQAYMMNKTYDIMLDLVSKPLRWENSYSELYNIYEDLKYIPKEKKSHNHEVVYETLRNVFSLDTASVK